METTNPTHFQTFKSRTMLIFHSIVPEVTCYQVTTTGSLALVTVNIGTNKLYKILNEVSLICNNLSFIFNGKLQSFIYAQY